MKGRKTGTTILHCDRQKPDAYGAVHRPMHTSVAYTQADPSILIDIFQGKQSGYVYGRQGNPTTSALEDKLNVLENGIATACFSTGMAALTAVFFSLLRSGDHIIVSRYLFGNTTSLLNTLSTFGCEMTFVDATQGDTVAAAVRDNTRMVFVETIANPCTQIVDLVAIGCLCKLKGILYVVDNTMTSPYLFQPVDVNADLVVNSLSKYIGGHGNCLGGAVTDTGKFDWQRYPNIYDIYRKQEPKLWGITQIRKKGLRDMGATLQAESAHRIATGAETLELRVSRICRTALQLAEFFSSHPCVAKVLYPGIYSHPQHERAQSLFKLFGGLLSIELKKGIDCLQFLRNLEVVICSSHLGDNRTLAITPSNTIYFEMGAERRKDMGIEDSLVRISVGLEDAEDLISDFDQALASSGKH